ncbi:MAG: hypothetical protein ACP5JO_01030 [Candidatus Ratteibacteria bacterium]
MIFKLGSNHKRAISTTLTMLDELLVAIEKWVNGSQYQSVLYEEKNDLSASQRKSLKKQILALRGYLDTVKKDLGFTKTTQSALNDIWSRVAAFRENVMELGAKHLKRYGALSSETAEYMDNISEKLLLQLDGILETIKTGKR